MIEQMGENFVTRVGVLLASMNWDAVGRVESPSGELEFERKYNCPHIINKLGTTETLLSTGKALDGVESDNHA